MSDGTHDYHKTMALFDRGAPAQSAEFVRAWNAALDFAAQQADNAARIAHEVVNERTAATIARAIRAGRR